MRRLTLTAVLVAAALGLPGAAEAKKPPPAVDRAKKGLAQAVDAGRLDSADAARYRGILARVAHALPKLPGSRHANLQGNLNDVARQADRYNGPRALALFSMLDENVRYFAHRGPPAPQSDHTGADGAVYRYFPGHGLQFHPLANMAALNSHLAAGRTEQARQLVDALQARAIGLGDGSTVWEYLFPFDGGRPPWRSGMAQAVAAQALARASGRLDDPSLLDLAGRAYQGARRLTMSRPEGPWVRLYSFTKMAVFNAQLQTAISLHDYASLSGDQGADTVAERMREAVTTALPKLDTGYWTRYAIGGSEESRGYHDYVVSLLGRLKAQTQDTFWSDTADRFERYETEPPAFQLGPPAEPAAPGKGKAALKVTFWLSKRSSVVVDVGSGKRQLWLGHGWHSLTWPLQRARPGIYPVSLSASPIAGPRASTDLLPLVVLAKNEEPSG